MASAKVQGDAQMLSAALLSRPHQSGGGRGESDEAQRHQVAA